MFTFHILVARVGEWPKPCGTYSVGTGRMLFSGYSTPPISTLVYMELFL